MRLPVPFTKLPLRVDAEALAAEIAAVDPAQWRPHPQQMAGNDALPLIAAGGDHICARLSDGSARCWGYNFEGQLGHGDLSNTGDNPNLMGDNLFITKLFSNLW